MNLDALKQEQLKDEMKNEEYAKYLENNGFPKQPKTADDVGGCERRGRISTPRNTL